MPRPQHYTEIYTEQLQTVGEGSALWFPEPQSSGEVQIGDVGYIYEGYFVRLFNSISPAPDAEIPDGFEPLKKPNKTELRVRERVLIPKHYNSESVVCRRAKLEGHGSVGPGVDAEVGWKYLCTKDKGAVLTLGNFARGELALVEKRFEQYAGKLHDIMGKTISDLPNHKILLVRGWVKTTADWAATTFIKSNTEVELSLGAGAPAAASVQGSVSWRSEEKGPVMHRMGIYADDPRNNNLQRPANAEFDQCIFVRCCHVKHRHFWVNFIMRGGAGPDVLPDQRDANFGLDGPAMSAADIDGDMDIGDDELQPQGVPRTPMDALLDYILLNSPETNVAGQNWPDDITQWLRDEAPRVEVDENGIGTISLSDAICARREYYIKNGLPSSPVDIPIPDTSGDEPPSRPRQAEGCSSDFPQRKALGVGELVLGNSSRGTLKWPHLLFKDEKLESGASLAMTTSPDGKFVATSCDDSTIILWDTRKARAVSRLDGHADVVWALAFSPDGTRLVSGGEDTFAKVWDVSTMAPHNLHTLAAHSAAVWISVFSPNSQMIATGSTDCSAKVWDATNGHLLHAFDEHPADVTQMAFSPNNRFFASCADCFCFIWDVETGAKAVDLVGHSAVIWCMRFSNKGDRIITGSEDNTARVWDACSGDELVTIREHTGPVWSVSFSPDDKEVVTAAYDCVVATCDSFSGERHHIFYDGQNDSPVNAVAYSKSGGFLASGSADGIVRLWDISAGNLMAEFRGHEEKVKAVVFTEGDSDIISSSEDGTVRIWNVHDVLRLY